MGGSEPGYHRGDVVLVKFIFTDEAGVKRRPALVLSTDAYHRGRREAIVAAITSNIERLLTGDHLIADWKAAGLPYPSTVTGIIRTIKQTMIYRQLGTLVESDMRAVEQNLRQILGL